MESTCLTTKSITCQVFFQFPEKPQDKIKKPRIGAVLSDRLLYGAEIRQTRPVLSPDIVTMLRKLKDYHPSSGFSCHFCSSEWIKVKGPIFFGLNMLFFLIYFDFNFVVWSSLCYQVPLNIKRVDQRMKILIFCMTARLRTSFLWVDVHDFPVLLLLGIFSLFIQCTWPCLLNLIRFYLSKQFWEDSWSINNFFSMFKGYFNMQGI